MHDVARPQSQRRYPYAEVFKCWATWNCALGFEIRRVALCGLRRPRVLSACSIETGAVVEATANVEDDPAAHQGIYELVPKVEQTHDLGMNGAALVCVKKIVALLSDLYSSNGSPDQSAHWPAQSPVQALEVSEARSSSRRAHVRPIPRQPWLRTAPTCWRRGCHCVASDEQGARPGREKRLANVY